MREPKQPVHASSPFACGGTLCGVSQDTLESEYPEHVVTDHGVITCRECIDTIKHAKGFRISRSPVEGW